MPTLSRNLTTTLNLSPISHVALASEQPASIHAKLVDLTEKCVSGDAEALAAKAQKIFDRHFGVLCNLQALRAARYKTFLVTTESQASDANETQSDRKPVSFRPDFDTLCSPCEVELDKLDFLPLLEEDGVNLLAPFYKHLMSGFGMASVLAPDDEQYILKY